MVLNILATILGVFGLVYFESFLVALFSFRLFPVLFFFLFQKIDWKFFYPLCAVTLLIFDIVYKLPLGSNLLIFSLPFGLYLLFSMIFTLDSGIVSLFFKLCIFWFYYILLVLLPNLFLSGEFGLFDINDLLSSLLRAVFSVLVLLLLEKLYAGFRKRGNTSQIRLK
jgi:hypothetical protein